MELMEVIMLTRAVMVMVAMVTVAMVMVAMGMLYGYLCGITGPEHSLLSSV